MWDRLVILSHLLHIDRAGTLGKPRKDKEHSPRLAGQGRGAEEAEAPSCARAGQAEAAASRCTVGGRGGRRAGEDLLRVKELHGSEDEETMSSLEEQRCRQGHREAARGVTPMPSTRRPCRGGSAAAGKPCRQVCPVDEEVLRCSHKRREKKLGDK